MSADVCEDTLSLGTALMIQVTGSLKRLLITLTREKILPHSRFAYGDGEETGESALFDIFVNEGGAWVWRHDNGRKRDYFVKDKKVVQYFVKPITPSEHEGILDLPDRTILGKQWVSQYILAEAGLNYTAFGEGSWAVDKKLTPVRNATTVNTAVM